MDTQGRADLPVNIEDEMSHESTCNIMSESFIPVLIGIDTSHILYVLL